MSMIKPKEEESGFQSLTVFGADLSETTWMDDENSMVLAAFFEQMVTG